MALSRAGRTGAITWIIIWDGCSDGSTRDPGLACGQVSPCLRAAVSLCRNGTSGSRGAQQRNSGFDKALSHWIAHQQPPSLLYMADDDNYYSPRLFDALHEHRASQPIVAWAAQACSDTRTAWLKERYLFECTASRVLSGWGRRSTGRLFELDMSEFAIDMREFRGRQLRFRPSWGVGRGETRLLAELLHTRAPELASPNATRPQKAAAVFPHLFVLPDHYSCGNVDHGGLPLTLKAMHPH